MLDTNYIGDNGGFNITLKLHPLPGIDSHREGSIYLATNDPKSHLNIQFISGDSFSAIRWKSVEHCLSPEEAMWLRDELLKAYPIEA